MPRPGFWPTFALLAGSCPGSVLAQQPPAAPPSNATPPLQQRIDLRSEDRVLWALRANPITAPYRFAASWRNGRVVLSGRVGTKVIHDAAVSTAGATGVTVEDLLVIDTAEAFRSAAGPGAAMRPGPVAQRPGYGMAGAPGMGATTPYVYPQPLFGVYDDPFYGFEPPYISYPPWWGAITARRLDPPAMEMPPDGPNPQAPAPTNPPSTNASPTNPAGSSVPPDGHVEMTIDPRGVAVLRGIVPTLADKIAVGQKLSGTQGVTEIVNLLETRDARPPGAPQQAGAPAAAPPPSPENERPGNNPAPVAGPVKVPMAGPLVVPADEDPLTTRLRQSIAKRPNLANQAIRVEGQGGIAYLGGKVPTALEAMAAFRAVQQTRGVKSVVDSLEFAVPDADRKNPLIEQGRPEDVEPYLDAQIRRQVGDAAHIDRVRVNGDALEVRGTIPTAADKPRIVAILRSMALLRGYRIDAELRPE